MSNGPVSKFCQKPVFEDLFAYLNSFKNITYKCGIVYETVTVSNNVLPSQFVADLRGGLPILFIHQTNSFYIACRPLHRNKYVMLDDSFFGVTVKDTAFPLVLACYLTDVDVESNAGNVQMDIVQKIYHAFVYFKAKYGHHFYSGLTTAYRFCVFNGESCNFIKFIREYLDDCEDDEPLLTQVEEEKSSKTQELEKEYDLIIKRADELRKLLPAPEEKTPRKRPKAGSNDD